MSSDQPSPTEVVLRMTAEQIIKGANIPFDPMLEVDEALLVIVAEYVQYVRSPDPDPAAVKRLRAWLLNTLDFAERRDPHRSYVPLLTELGPVRALTPQETLSAILLMVLISTTTGALGFFLGVSS